MDQFKTPLYDALKKYNDLNPISLHVPGHKNGKISYGKDDVFYEQILRIDATELTGLDDLHSPEGVILEAENLLALAYQVKKSYFLVNGSTVGNLAMILGIAHEGDTVFVQRNCHKSVLNGIQLAKANPVLLGPELNIEWGIAGGVALDTVKEAYRLFPDCKAVILTYPNYYGMVNELKEIIEFCHGRKIPVLVDEAHGAHFIGGDFFPPSAVELGADIVVQSAHKTLPAMTMGSFLHVNSRYIYPEVINHYLQILQSSSPSYPIMGSLDLARSYIATYSKEDQEYLRKIIYAFKKELNSIEGIKVLEYENGQGDPLKVTIQSTSTLTGFELQSIFETDGIYSELADPYNVLFILPLLKEGMPYPFEFILDRIRRGLRTKRKSVPRSNKEQPIFMNEGKITTLHLQRLLSYSEKALPFSSLVNEISAETIIPYPPGVPLFLRGEKISKEHIRILHLLQTTGARFQGGKKLTDGQVFVFNNMEVHHE